MIGLFKMFTRNYKEKIKIKLFNYQKALKYSIRKPHKNTIPVCILGCGRSGTTMMINIFHRDVQVESLNENNPKIAQNYLLDFEKVSYTIKHSRAPVLVMKPILNSFAAKYLLSCYENAKIIWLVRDYKDMIYSSIDKFGDTVSNYLRDLIVYNKGENWLSKGITNELRKAILSMNVSRFTKYDWMAMVWFTVNQTIIVDKLYESERFILVKYEILVKNPLETVKDIYQFIGIKFKPNIVKYVHPGSVGKGKNIVLQNDVVSICNDLNNKLNDKILKTNSKLY